MQVSCGLWNKYKEWDKARKVEETFGDVNIMYSYVGKIRLQGNLDKNPKKPQCYLVMQHSSIKHPVHLGGGGCWYINQEIIKKGKPKPSLYRPEQALRVPGV
jgi:hypothetical protein